MKLQPKGVWEECNSSSALEALDRGQSLFGAPVPPGAPTNIMQPREPIPGSCDEPNGDRESQSCSAPHSPRTLQQEASPIQFFRSFPCIWPKSAKDRMMTMIALGSTRTFQDISPAVAVSNPPPGPLGSPPELRLANHQCLGSFWVTLVVNSSSTAQLESGGFGTPPRCKAQRNCLDCFGPGLAFNGGHQKNWPVVLSSSFRCSF